MTKKIVDTFNENLSKIKKDVNNLYDKSKTLYLSQLNKSFTSYLELNNVRKEDNTYEDTFQTFNKIEKKENIVYDNDGFNLKYEIIPVEFDNSYYTSTDGDIDMNNGEIIAGSFFGYIFDRSKGFWGYKSIEETNFSITLNLKKESLVNKIKFNTNNEITLKCYIQTINNGELEIGERKGKLHSWNFKPDTITGIRITGYGNLISVDYVECGLASYNQNGYLLGVQNKTKNFIEEYNIKDLYNLKITADTDIPVGTNIEFKYINNNQEYDFQNGEAVLPSGYKVILNQGIYPENTIEDIIIGNIFTSGNYRCFKLYKDYVEDSLEVRYGYNEWQKIDTTYDVSELVPETIEDPNNPSEPIVVIDKSHLDSDEYIYINDESVKLEEGCIKQVYQGTDTFELNTDYIPDYRDIENRRIYIKIPSTSKLLDIYINDLKFVIIGKKKEIVKQYKCYVNLNEDDVINIQPFEACDIEIRHVVIDNNIEKDETLRYAYNDYSYLPLIQNIPTIQVQGYKGINMIEFTKFTDNTYTKQSFLDNDYLMIQNHIFYPFKYKLKQVNKLFDNPFEYTIQKIEDYENLNDNNKNYYLISMLNNNIPYSISNINNFTISYLRNIGNVDKKVKIKAYLSSSDGLNTPTLRSYKLENNKKSINNVDLFDINQKYYKFSIKTDKKDSIITLFINNDTDNPIIFHGSTGMLQFVSGTVIEYQAEYENYKKESGFISLLSDTTKNIEFKYAIQLTIENVEDVPIDITINGETKRYTNETPLIYFRDNDIVNYVIKKIGYQKIENVLINNTYIDTIRYDNYLLNLSLTVTAQPSTSKIQFFINNVLDIEGFGTLNKSYQEGTKIKFIVTDVNEIYDTHIDTIDLLNNDQNLNIVLGDEVYLINITSNQNDALITLINNGVTYSGIGSLRQMLVNNTNYSWTMTKQDYVTERGSGIIHSNINEHRNMQIAVYNITGNTSSRYRNGVGILQTITISKSGNYTIELGGEGISSNFYGYGGKIISNINLSAGDELKVKYISGYVSSDTSRGGNGTGIWLNGDENENCILVAGGGGAFWRTNNYLFSKINGGGGYNGGRYLKDDGEPLGAVGSGYSYDGSIGNSTNTAAGCGKSGGYADMHAYGGSYYIKSPYTGTRTTDVTGNGYCIIRFNE